MERAPHGPERMREHLEAEPKNERHLEHKQERHEHHETNNHKRDEVIESARQSVEQQAISAKELNVTEQENAQDDTPLGVHQELKRNTYNHTLKQVRRRLNTPEKTLSKVIHQPAIEKASQAAGSTVARPSGILGGGVAALLGTAILLFASRYYGFSYNYFAFIALFSAGFLIGIVGEMLLKAVLIRKK